LPIILQNLKKSIEYKDLISTNKYGKELIYNRHLTARHLQYLKIKLDQTFGENEALSALRNLIYNKE
jgi:hypothetical protein